MSYAGMGLSILRRLRDEPFNKQTINNLQNHPYLKAAEDGTLTFSQRRAFAREQYFIQLSDAISFATLAGHTSFRPKTLTDAIVPAPKKSTSDQVDLFQFLLGGEIHASELLLSYAKPLGLDENILRNPVNCGYNLSAKAQAYPSYWSKLALTKNKGAAAAAIAVNFPAWGEMCKRLLDALASKEKYGYKGIDDEALAFIKFFATPIENLDEMAASIIEKEKVKYPDLVEHVRILQEYEIMFWDGIFEKKGKEHKIVQAIEISGCGVPGANGVYTLSDKMYHGVYTYTKRGTWEGKDELFEMYYLNDHEFINGDSWVIGCAGHKDFYRLYLDNPTTSEHDVPSEKATWSQCQEDWVRPLPKWKHII